MSDTVTLFVNGRATTVKTGTPVAAAVLLSGETRFRTSVQGEPRGALCGMGICFECRVTIDGKPHSRSCQTLCRKDMCVLTT